MLLAFMLLEKAADAEFFKQKTAYEMRISDWSSDVCSSDLQPGNIVAHAPDAPAPALKPLRRDEHGKVRLAAGGREGRRDILDVYKRQARMMM